MMDFIRSVSLILFFVLLQPTEQILYSCNRNASCGCSLNPASFSRIVGGEAAGRATWGWAVSISIDDKYLCGGSIISNSWIVTAAHCFYHEEHPIITVYAGSNLQWAGSQSRLVSEVIMHPNYDDTTYSNDIALLKLNAPLNTSDPDISSICIPLISEASLTSGEWPLVNTTVVAVGWGRLSEGGMTPGNLQQVSLQTIDSSKLSCNRIIHNNAIQFCAEAPDGMKDTCQGDSGGPLMMFTEDRQWVLVGLTSFGYGCAQPNYAGVYTRVAAYKTWIQSHTNTFDWVRMDNSNTNGVSSLTHHFLVSITSVMFYLLANF